MSSCRTTYTCHFKCDHTTAGNTPREVGLGCGTLVVRTSFCILSLVFWAGLFLNYLGFDIPDIAIYTGFSG